MENLNLDASNENAKNENAIAKKNANAKKNDSLNLNSLALQGEMRGNSADRGKSALYSYPANLQGNNKEYERKMHRIAKRKELKNFINSFYNLRISLGNISKRKDANFAKDNEEIKSKMIKISKEFIANYRLNYLLNDYSLDSINGGKSFSDYSKEDAIALLNFAKNL